MMSPAKYSKYQELSRSGVEKAVKLGMVFRDIVHKENMLFKAQINHAHSTTTSTAVAQVNQEGKLKVTESEIAEQYNALVAQAKQKGEPAPDEMVAR